MRIIAVRCILAFLLTLATACTLIAPYDQVAYEKATSTKAETLTLMGKATGSYTSNQKDIDDVKLDVDKAYEYERGRASNAETTKMYEILRDPDGHLFGGFLRRWHDRGSLHEAYIEEKKRDVGDAFDQIIGLERGKPRAASQ